MKNVIILVNDNRITSAFNINIKEYPFRKTIDDVCVHLLEDNSDLVYIKGEVNNKPDYMAIHTSVNAENTGSNIINKNDDWLKDTHIKDFHSDGDFYKEILPLILDEELNEFPWEVFNKYFQTDLELALNLLHDIYSGVEKDKFENENNKDIRENENVKEKYNDLVGEVNWTYNQTENEKLVLLRDVLVKEYATY